jgi:acetyl esterase/lipase
MLFVAMMFLGSNLFAQRYLDDVFSAVNKTTNVVYDSNRAVNIIPPNNPPIITQNLICDIYQPAGDSLCKRPVIILLHTGSYLPTLVNQQTTGSKNDSNVVEIANRFAKKGYVVVAMNYRLGWNPATTNQAAAAEQLIKATYRAIQDVRNCVRFMRKNAATYRVDTAKIIVGGQGTGGYVALGLAAVNKRSEIETNPKFLRGDFSPMVSVDTLGDWNGLGGNPFFNYSGEPELSGNVHMVFNFGGAMGDSTWMDNATLPIVSLHCLKDPFAPYRTGNVIVPTTGITVIPSASGAGSVIPFANSLGINNKINSKTYTDPISVRATALTGGVNNLYPFWTLTPEGSPWEWWDRAFVQSINFPSPGAGRIADSLSMLTNPFMSAARARAYCDTIVGFVNPRIVTQFDLDLPSAIDSISIGNLLAPASNTSITVYNDSTKNINISWSPSCSPFTSLGSINYSWAITDSSGNFTTPILKVPTGTNTSLTLTEKAVWDLLGSAAIPVGGSVPAKWTVFANIGSTSVKYATWNITLTRGTNVGLLEVDNKAAFNVYPNPTSGVVNFASAQKISAVRIIDITGKSVVETNETKIDVSTLNKGIYFVEVTLENGAKATKRLLVN